MTEINNNIGRNNGEVNVDASHNEAGRDLNRNSPRDPLGCIFWVMMVLIGCATLAALITGAW